jgi:hypothetical protein
MKAFTSSKVISERISLPPRANGLFKKGKSSAKVKTKGVPDLVFNEVNFLNPKAYTADSEVASYTVKKKPASYCDETLQELVTEDESSSSEPNVFMQKSKRLGIAGSRAQTFESTRKHRGKGGSSSLQRSSKSRNSESKEHSARSERADIDEESSLSEDSAFDGFSIAKKCPKTKFHSTKTTISRDNGIPSDVVTKSGNFSTTDHGKGTDIMFPQLRVVAKKGSNFKNT